MLRKLEKYELLEEIGHGGMATVYKARDERLDRLVAIKVLHPHLRKAPEARVRFTREARSVAKLHHPNILEIYDYSGEDSEESYIAAELLTGPTLRRFIDDGAELPAEIAACFTIQIASALAAAHESGIIHRDVKPENVLLHENRCVKLTDFGIAQMVDSQSFTATGQILGSPGHMAPEQVAGTNIDARTDVFSLGTVLFFLAVGRLPFTGRNPHQVLKRIVDAEFPDPLRIRPQIGGELRAVLLKAMARDPDDRFQTVDEFQEALVAFVGRLDVEKPDALLERYLRDPDETTSSLRERALRAYMDLGRKAAEQKDRGAALDALNRVLALDEGNDEALRLIERLSSQDRRARAAGVG
ncbi:MAG: serine/threonine-protein kinase, partial [Myxococcota bacterium]